MYAHNGILFIFKNEGNSDMCYHMDEPRRHAKCNEPDTKEHIVYDSTHMRHLKWSDSHRQKVERWSPGPRGRKECGGVFNGYSFHLGR